MSDVIRSTAAELADALAATTFDGLRRSDSTHREDAP